MDGQYYVEVKDHPYRIHPTENLIIRKRKSPKCLRTQYQGKNETETRKNQTVVQINGILEVKNYPEKKQTIQQQPKFIPPNCPSCNQNSWLEFDKGYYCQNCEYIMNEQKHQKGENVRRQDHYFSTRLPYANKRIKEKYYSMANTKNTSSDDMINNL